MEDNDIISKQIEIKELFNLNKIKEGLELYLEIIKKIKDMDMLKIVNIICIEKKLLSNKNKNIRILSYKLLESIIDNINIYGISLIMNDLLVNLDDYKIESKSLLLDLFKYISEKKEIIIKNNLQEIIPVVSNQMISNKIEISKKSKELMLLICKTSGNKDIEPFIEDIIKSVVSPEEVIKCINGLASTVFIQKVETSALAVIEPLLVRGLREKKISILRKIGTIVDNMLLLVDNVCDASPFIERVLPGLKYSYDIITDLEAKKVVEKAFNRLDNISDKLKEFKDISSEDITTMIEKELCFNNILDIDKDIIVYKSNICSDLILKRNYNLDSWKVAIDINEIYENILEQCKKVSKPIEIEENIYEEGEDLCNCEFTLGYATKILLSNTRLHLKRGKRYGLVGPNDCGKSTLMRSIANEQLEGFPKSDELKCVYVEHDIQGVDTSIPVLDFVFLDPNCKDIDKDTVIKVLESVGFSTEKEVSKGASQHMSITSLSGGWKMKLALARAMLAKADILLLDEPTNHLDRDNVAWVKNYLLSLDNVTSILVSHDSKFMDDVCSHIIHFEDKKLVTYIGNLESFVKKVPSAKSYYEFKTTKLKFEFPEPTLLDGIKSKGKPILEMNNVSFTYPGSEKKVLNDVSVRCTLNSRIAVIGPNGAGKSTAIKVLTGELTPDTGKVNKHPNMRFAYVAQNSFHHLEKHLEKTPSEYIIWRYGVGYDRELSLKDTCKLTDEEKILLKKPLLVKVEEGSKLVEKKLVVERLLQRRKKKNSYEYEVKWENLSDENNKFMARDILEKNGFKKLLDLCDDQENSRMTGNPCTQKNVLEHLKSFGLDEEYALHTPINSLSGGQKVRVVLAAGTFGIPHLIILDEPTNYLDRDALAALADAIHNFEGGVVLISHNKDFVEHVCKVLWIMSNGTLKQEGDEGEDEKIKEKTIQEETTDHLGNTTKNKIKKNLSKSEIKKMKKIITNKIKENEQLDSDEENFAIEYNL